MNGKIKAVLLLAVMYGLGAISGIAWQRYRFHRFPNAHMMFADRRLKRLKSQLNLTTEQETSMRDIFQKAHERAMQVNEEVSWDLADIHKDTVKSIEKILMPVQLAKFEKLHQKYHEKHKNNPSDDLDEPEAATRKVKS
jgi:Spy/CpxP family protein refolding chaperone